MKALLLLSGGFDSVVAGFLMKKKGLELLAIHFSHEPFTDNKAELKTKKLAAILNIQTLFVAKAGEAFGELTKSCNHKLYFVLSKRLMYKVADTIAKKEHCTFLITGENIGQVSSQVLSNLQNIDRASSLPVLRPLLCFDKEEIIHLARTFGTYETSCGPEICDILGPKHPATHSKNSEIILQESKLDTEALIHSILAKIKKEELTTLKNESIY